MTHFQKLSISGIRSYNPDEKSTIIFNAPLTIILGRNGSGKTTIIESLKYVTTGELPPNSKGGAFLYDPRIIGRNDTHARVKLELVNDLNQTIVVSRSSQATLRPNGVISQKTLESTILLDKEEVTSKKSKMSNNISEKEHGSNSSASKKSKISKNKFVSNVVENDDSSILSSSNRCMNINEEIQKQLNVSSSILEYINFCHQEESQWILSEPGNLKKKLDEIFATEKYSKSIENTKLLRKFLKEKFERKKFEFEFVLEKRTKKFNLQKIILKDSEKIILNKKNLKEIENKIKENENENKLLENESEKLNENYIKWEYLKKIKSFSIKKVFSKKDLKNDIQKIETYSKNKAVFNETDLVETRVDLVNVKDFNVRDRKEIVRLDDSKDSSKVNGKYDAGVNRKGGTAVNGKDDTAVNGNNSSMVNGTYDAKVNGNDRTPVNGTYDGAVNEKNSSTVNGKYGNISDLKYNNASNGKDGNVVNGKYNNILNGKDGSAANGKYYTLMNKTNGNIGDVKDGSAANGKYSTLMNGKDSSAVGARDYNIDCPKIEGVSEDFTKISKIEDYLKIREVSENNKKEDKMSSECTIVGNLSDIHRIKVEKNDNKKLDPDVNEIKKVDGPSDGDIDTSFMCFLDDSALFNNIEKEVSTEELVKLTKNVDFEFYLNSLKKENEDLYKRINFIENLTHFLQSNHDNLNYTLNEINYFIKIQEDFQNIRVEIIATIKSNFNEDSYKNINFEDSIENIIFYSKNLINLIENNENKEKLAKLKEKEFKEQNEIKIKEKQNNQDQSEIMFLERKIDDLEKRKEFLEKENDEIKEFKCKFTNDEINVFKEKNETLFEKRKNKKEEMNSFLAKLNDLNIENSKYYKRLGVIEGIKKIVEAIKTILNNITSCNEYSLDKIVNSIKNIMEKIEQLINKKINDKDNKQQYNNSQLSKENIHNKKTSKDINTSNHTDEDSFDFGFLDEFANEEINEENKSGEKNINEEINKEIYDTINLLSEAETYFNNMYNDLSNKEVNLRREIAKFKQNTDYKEFLDEKVDSLMNSFQNFDSEKLESEINGIEKRLMSFTATIQVYKHLKDKSASLDMCYVCQRPYIDEEKTKTETNLQRIIENIPIRKNEYINRRNEIKSSLIHNECNKNKDIKITEMLQNIVKLEEFVDSDTNFKIFSANISNFLENKISKNNDQSIMLMEYTINDIIKYISDLLPKYNYIREIKNTTFTLKNEFNILAEKFDAFKECKNAEYVNINSKMKTFNDEIREFDNEIGKLNIIFQEISKEKDQIQKFKQSETNKTTIMAIFNEINSKNIFLKERITAYNKNKEILSEIKENNKKIKKEIEEIAHSLLISENNRKYKMQSLVNLENNYLNLNKRVNDITKTIQNTNNILTSIKQKLELSFNMFKDEFIEFQTNMQESFLSNHTNNLIIENNEFRKLPKNDLINNVGEMKKKIENIFYIQNKINQKYTLKQQEYTKKIKYLEEERSSIACIKENIIYLQKQEEAVILENELKELKFENLENIKQNIKDTINAKAKLNAQKYEIIGEQKQLETGIEEKEKEIKTYSTIEAEYRKTYTEIEILKILKEDIEKCIKTLENRLLEYHNDKIHEINSLMKELWIETYKGNDIDYIMLKCETYEKKAYNYRLDMVRNGIELEFRGRCSAGQKVLAGIVTRLALCDVFSPQFPILALDEPTTNLDHDNIESLAETINNLVKKRNDKGRLQLILITHDKKFMKLLSKELCDTYCYVRRQNNGDSEIKILPFS